MDMMVSRCSKTLKVVPTAAMSDTLIDNLIPNRRNSVTCIVRTSRQSSCNQSVGCLQQLGSSAFGPAKQSGLWYSSCPFSHDSIYTGVTN